MCPHCELRMNAKALQEEEDYLRVTSVQSEKEMTIKVSILPNAKRGWVKKRALLDCGAQGIFLNKTFAQRNGFEIMEHPPWNVTPLRNADGTYNKDGPLKYYTRFLIRFGDHLELATAEVTETADDDLMLGHNWLRRHNPEVDWKTGEVQMTRCTEQCKRWSKAIREGIFGKRKYQDPIQKNSENSGSIGGSSRIKRMSVEEEKIIKDLVPGLLAVFEGVL